MTSLLSMTRWIIQDFSDISLERFKLYFEETLLKLLLTRFWTLKKLPVFLKNDANEFETKRIPFNSELHLWIWIFLNKIEFPASLTSYRESIRENGKTTFWMKSSIREHIFTHKTNPREKTFFLFISHRCLRKPTIHF